ncbi:MAG TPA: type II secretion system F family protein [Geobacteraceae bacterium]
MALYTCKLGSSDGRVIVKELEAASREMLQQTLEEQGFYVFEVKKKTLQFLWDKGIARKRVSNKELLTFNQELLVLIKAGLPIIQVFDTILERSEKGKLPEILKDVREDIKGGAALSEAFEKFPAAFSHLYVASIRAGEKTGDLPLTIKRYINFSKRAEGLRKKVLAALFYPAILVTVAAIAVTVLLVYVVPTFSKIYADSGSQLPVPTQVLITFTTYLKRYFLVFVGGVIALIVMFRRWSETEWGRFKVDTLKLKLPLLGKIFTKYAVSGFTRTFGTVLGSGIPIVESLKMSVGTLNNKVLERKLLDAVGRVEEGTSLSVALENVKLMPPLAIRMLGVGETTGSLEEMLGEISEYFESEIDEHLHILTTAIEPAIMIVMGLVVGVIIITMYLPIFKIAGTVG